MTQTVKMRNILQFGIHARNGWLPLEELYRQVKLIDQYGFDSLWRAEHLVLAPSWRPCYDTFCLFAKFASITENVKLGFAVTDAFRRHPLIMAQTVMTLDHISEGRIILGVGAGEAMNTEPLGIPFERPVKRMKEYIQLVKRLFVNADPTPKKTITYDGEFYKLRDAFVQITPMQKPHPPIIVSAMGSMSRRVAGELGDGWVTMYETPSKLSEHLKEIKEAGERAGRDMSKFQAAYWVPFALTEKAEEARAVVERSDHYDLLAWPKHAKEVGLEVPEELDYSELIINAEVEAKFKKIKPQIPLDQVEDFLIFGDPEECVEKIAKFAKAGVTHFILSPRAPPLDTKTMYELFNKEVRPHFRE